MECLGVDPGAAWWKVQTNPLSFFVAVGRVVASKTRDSQIKSSKFYFLQSALKKALSKEEREAWHCSYFKNPKSAQIIFL